VTKRDYYEVLDVSRDADGDALKRAYRRTAMRYHPDRNPDDPEAEERFKEASEAYAVLSDPQKRARYDRMGHAAFGAPGTDFEPIDFGAVSELFEGLFGDVFGRRSRRTRGGRDLKYELELTFEEAALGVEKEIDVTRPTLCETCGGSGARPGTTPNACPGCRGTGEIRYQRGFFGASRPCPACRGTGHQITDPCEACSGEGVVSKTERMSVRLPAGVEDGSIRTVRGAGEQRAGGAGDLHIQVRVKAHPLFSRQGADIHCIVPISFPQAVLGTQLEVPTLEGKVRMRLPEGTPSGKIFRLRGKGLPSLGGAGKGDQLVRVVVEVPEKVNREQRRLLEQLASEMGTETHPQQRGFLEKLRDLFG